MSRIMIRNCLIAGMTILPMGALASDLNYTYGQISYVSTEVGGGIDADGVAVSGSMLLNHALFLTGGFARVESDRIFEAGPRLTLDSFDFGVGYRRELIRDTTDFNLRASFLRSEGTFKGGGFSGGGADTGYGVSAGIRHLFTQQVELVGSVQYSDIFSQRDTAFRLQGLYHFTEFLSAVAAYTTGSDIDTWSAGIRFHF